MIVTSRRRNRVGTSVVEALVALLLGLLLLAVCLALLSRQRSIQVALAQRMDMVGTVRAVRHIVGTELHRDWSALDYVVHAPDSLTLRAYRGIARVCSVQSWNRLLVSVEGTRLPDPRKDSVLFLTADGGAASAAVLSIGPGDAESCAPRPGRPRTLEVSDSVPPGVVLIRYFERGSYHLSGRALRYRRGLAGRQPLTPESLGTPASAFSTRHGGGVDVVLEPRLTPSLPWKLSLTAGGR